MVDLNDLQKRWDLYKERFVLFMDHVEEDLLIQEIRILQDRASASGFWDDQGGAQAVMQELSQKQALLDRITEVRKLLQETEEFLSWGEASLSKEVESFLDSIGKNIEVMEVARFFDGPYDGYNSIVSIHAGTGGVDAQDWAQMLLRMYMRYADSKSWRAILLNQNPGEEAGIKNADFLIRGQDAYGHLQAEHGVHRLVRLSPFNAKNSRETSFALVEVIPEFEKVEDVVLDMSEVKIDVFRASGHGGQSVNTTDSAVRVTHLPTGIVVSCQNERSQLQNKQTALMILRSRLHVLAQESSRLKLKETKGEFRQGSWGNQIRSYVLQPYTLVKDHRTDFETSDTDGVLDGDVDQFVQAWLRFKSEG